MLDRLSFCYGALLSPKSKIRSGSRFEELEKRVSDYVDRFVSMRGGAIILSNCPPIDCQQLQSASVPVIFKFNDLVNLFNTIGGDWPAIDRHVQCRK